MTQSTSPKHFGSNSDIFVPAAPEISRWTFCFFPQVCCGPSMAILTMLLCFRAPPPLTRTVGEECMPPRHTIPLLKHHYCGCSIRWRSIDPPGILLFLFGDRPELTWVLDLLVWYKREIHHRNANPGQPHAAMFSSKNSLARSGLAARDAESSFRGPSGWTASRVAVKCKSCNSPASPGWERWGFRGEFSCDAEAGRSSLWHSAAAQLVCRGILSHVPVI